jgi:peptide/nickel transport system ATP-binding protein
VVSDICERVVVMYAGRIAETGPAAAILGRPAHPYARALLSAIPRLEGPIGDLPAIPGVVPAPADFPIGCRFAPRCAHAIPACEAAPPALRDLPSGTAAACIRAEEIA